MRLWPPISAWREASSPAVRPSASTDAPRRARTSAVMRPIPLVAPVTSTVLPANSCVSSLIFCPPRPLQRKRRRHPEPEPRSPVRGAERSSRRGSRRGQSGHRRLVRGAPRLGGGAPEKTSSVVSPGFRAYGHFAYVLAIGALDRSLRAAGPVPARQLRPTPRV